MAKSEKIDLVRQTFLLFLLAASVLLAIVAAGNLLYSAFCAFTWGKFEMMDYGVYTNMLWNSAQGHLFKHHMNLSYLYTHLSFSLVLLAPLFRIWDSPMVLLFAQWGMVITGAAILVRTLRVHGVPREMIGALVLMLVGHRFTQSALMSEFHGIAAYYLLVPWLYYALSLRQKAAWFPLALILGVREDAFIFLLPLLIYFSVKHRSVENYAMLALTLCYGLLAVFVLYPAINGVTVFQRRSVELNVEKILDISRDNCSFRLHAIIMTYLPALVFCGRKWFPAFWFPFAALAAALSSALHGEQSLGSHHPPPVITMMVLGLAETTVLRMKEESIKHRMITARAALLVVLVIAVHAYSGFLFMGGKSDKIFRSPNFRGFAAMEAAAHIPREGALAVDKDLAVYCANRENIITWKRYIPEKHHYDIVFGTIDQLGHMDDGRVLQGIEDQEWGAYYFDGMFLVLKKGHDTSRNGELLRAFKYGPVPVPFTLKHGGKDPLFGSGGSRTRYWAGEGHRAPITLSYGGTKELEAGRYRAVFRYRAEKPQNKDPRSWGMFSVHYLNDQGPPLAAAEVEHAEAAADEFIVQNVPFTVRKRADIEFRITGGDAQLWLDSVAFLPADKGN